MARLRQHGSERCLELAKLLEVEEQTRCRAFQGVLMREVAPDAYQQLMRRILDKFLTKLAATSNDPALYRCVAGAPMAPTTAAAPTSCGS